MSIEAISWVLKQDIARSSEKFVLLCMANYSDDRGFCYPSMAALERDTSQDRKTVLGNVKRLMDSILLRDTGRRVGATRQIIVYQLVGLPDSSRVHYVYRLTHPTTGEFYIGKRSFNGHPELDSYRGSGRWPSLMRGEGASLHREVLGTFATSEEALAAEVQWFRRCDSDPLCKNDQLPSRMRILSDLKSPENGPLLDDEESRFSGETVPLFPDNSPKNGTRNHQGTVKESVNRKRTGKPLPELPSWIPAEPWAGFVAMRKEKRKPLSEHACELIFAKLGEFRSNGDDLAMVLNNAIENQWTTVYPLRKAGVRGPKGEPEIERKRTADEAMRLIEQGGAS